MKDCIFANVMVNNSNIPTGSSLRVVMAIWQLSTSLIPLFGSLIWVKGKVCEVGEGWVVGARGGYYGSTESRAGKDARKLAAIAIVAAWYGGDMDEELCNELTSLTSVATRQILS